MLKLIKKKQKTPVTLQDHYNRRNKILIKRRTGGFGDILMTRMMFEDFQKKFPEFEFTFACPSGYLEMAKNHPYVNACDLSQIKEENFGIVYDISNVCRMHETKTLNNKKHRSDIWAEFCGIELNNHNMHISTDPKIDEICKIVLERLNTKNKPKILLATQSTSCSFGISKSLNHKQITNLVNNLKDKFFLYTIHNEKQAIYDELPVEQIVRITPSAWISLVNLADCVISVDTATFHLAGGLKKPLVGVFTFTDGKVYGKYYDFILAQKHRDNGDWDCGPCYNLNFCPKTSSFPKPCLTELSDIDILKAVNRAFEKWNIADTISDPIQLTIQ